MDKKSKYLLESIANADLNGDKEPVEEEFIYSPNSDDKLYAVVHRELEKDPTLYRTECGVDTTHWWDWINDREVRDYPDIYRKCKRCFKS